MSGPYTASNCKLPEQLKNKNKNKIETHKYINK